MRNKLNGLKRFWTYYFKGDYHCDTCPFCWGGEYMPGCDDYDDCGCYIRKDIRESCRLIPPIRFLLGWGKRKKAIYYQNHEYDNYGEWWEKRIEMEEMFNEAFRHYLKAMGYGIVHADKDGRVIPNDGKCKVLEEYHDLYRFMDECEDIFISVKFVPLKEKWKAIIKESLEKFLMLFKPYFCK